MNSYHPLTVSGLQGYAGPKSSAKTPSLPRGANRLFKAVGGDFELPEKRRVILGLFFISFEL
jgi:hypothetical protein